MAWLEMFMEKRFLLEFLLGYAERAWSSSRRYAAFPGGLNKVLVHKEEESMPSLFKGFLGTGAFKRPTKRETLDAGYCIT